MWRKAHIRHENHACIITINKLRRVGGKESVVKKKKKKKSLMRLFPDSEGHMIKMKLDPM